MELLLGLPQNGPLVERGLPLARVAESVAGAPGQQAVEVWNSPLNEAAVLSFEYGHSLG